MSRKHCVRVSAIGLAVAGLVVVGAGNAVAHITTDPSQVTRDEYNSIAFRVPNESPTAGTVKIELTLPADHPITSVRTAPLTGWKAEITSAKLDTPVTVDNTKITEAVHTVTWTADPGVRIAPGQYGVFSILTGTLPTDTDTLKVPAIQTYDDGEVVRWIAPPAAQGQEEPEFPAPIVRLTSGSAEGGHQAAASAAGSEDTTARWLAGVGIGIGALGLGVGLGMLMRARRWTVKAEKSSPQ